MGMIDIVTCDYPLHDCPPECDSFQIKDGNNRLDWFHIRSDGQLILNKGGLGRTELDCSQMTLTGELYFYDYDKKGEIIGYEACFVNGKITSVERIYEG